MHGVKLLAAPLVFSIAGQTLELQRVLSQSHFAGIETCPLPMSIHDWIAKCSAVWRADFLSVVKIFVAVVVASKARKQRAAGRVELSAAMLFVTLRATDSRILVLMNDGRNECTGRVT